jgi:transcriptional regulator with XRE-family HTH domain
LRIKYVGPARPGIDVHLPDGVTVHVPYGKQRTVPDEVARGLLAQGEEHWQLVSHYGHEPEPVQLADPLRPGDVARLMIHRLRQERGWTQAQLAARLEQTGHPLGQTNLSRIESGQRRLSIDDLTAICAALNVSPLRVLTGDRLDPQPPVTVVPPVTVPLSRYRSWLRSTTPLPAPTDWRQVSQVPWTNAFRAVLAPEDTTGLQQKLANDLTPAAQAIADCATEARDQLTDETRIRLADAIDEFNRRLKKLNDSTSQPSPRRERRGRPRAS